MTYLIPIPSELTEEEIDEIRQQFKKDEETYGCGFYPVCRDHQCLCTRASVLDWNGFNINELFSMQEYGHGLEGYETSEIR